MPWHLLGLTIALEQITNKELENKKVKACFIDNALYGEALKKGMGVSKYETLVQFDLDLIDLIFLRKALKRIKNCDVVVGSKNLAKSRDKRPIFRLMITKLLNIAIRVLFDYPGTDTHGIKVCKKSNAVKYVGKIKSNHHFFCTELLIKMHHEGGKIVELPVSVRELRQSRFPAAQRIISGLGEFASLLLRRKELLGG